MSVTAWVSNSSVAVLYDIVTEIMSLPEKKKHRVPITHINWLILFKEKSLIILSITYGTQNTELLNVKVDVTYSYQRALNVSERNPNHTAHVKTFK
jgi:hypothetical protein